MYIFPPQTALLRYFAAYHSPTSSVRLSGFWLQLNGQASPEPTLEHLHLRNRSKPVPLALVCLPLIPPTPTFCNWLHSLGVAFSRFQHAIGWIGISFIMNHFPLRDYTTLSLSIHLMDRSFEVKVKVRSAFFVTPWTVAHQAPLSMGCPRQEYWSGLPFPSPGDLPNPGVEPTSLALQADS